MNEHFRRMGAGAHRRANPDRASSTLRPTGHLELVATTKADWGQVAAGTEIPSLRVERMRDGVGVMVYGGPFYRRCADMTEFDAYISCHDADDRARVEELLNRVLD